MKLNNKSNQQEILNQYLNTLKKINNYSPNTIKSYKNDITQYLNEENKVGEFSNFLKICSKKNYSKSTINRKITSIRSFLIWSADNDYFERDLIKPVTSLKTDKKLPNVLTANYINELLDSLPVTNNKSLKYLNKPYIYKKHQTLI